MLIYIFLIHDVRLSKFHVSMGCKVLLKQTGSAGPGAGGAGEVLGMEPKSSARAVSAHNLQAVSAAPHSFYTKYLGNSNFSRQIQNLLYFKIRTAKKYIS